MNWAWRVSLMEFGLRAKIPVAGPGHGVTRGRVKSMARFDPFAGKNSIPDGCRDRHATINHAVSRRPALPLLLDKDAKSPVTHPRRSNADVWKRIGCEGRRRASWERPAREAG